MVRLGKETGIPLVATNDVHYTNREDWEFHDILLCIQTGKTVDQEDRLRFPNHEFYMKSEDEMRGLFPEVPEAVDNTARIAERCSVKLDFGTAPAILSCRRANGGHISEELVYRGFEERYPQRMRR